MLRKTAILIGTTFTLLVVTFLIHNTLSKGVCFEEDIAGNSFSTKTVMYCNEAEGYFLYYPEHMVLEESMAPLVTVLEDSQTRLEIYHEILTGATAEVYMAYSKAPIISGRDSVEILKKQTIRDQSKTYEELWWRRELVEKIADDKNYYAFVHIKKGVNEVYALHFKSSNLAALESLVPKIVNSISFFKPTGKSVFSLSHHSVRRYPLGAEAQEFLDKELWQKQHWGLFEPSVPGNFKQLKQYETLFDYRFKYLLVYSSLSSKLPMEKLKAAQDEDRVYLYTLQTLEEGKPQQSLTYALLKGAHDSYLRAFAKSLADYGKPILFRLNNEMNGDWCGYSAYHASMDAQLYIAFWRQLYEIFHEEGADNVLWVWNPHDRAFPNFKYNHALMYYPGDAYVDVIGLTGYNTGTYYPGETWRGFNEIYQDLYFEYLGFFSGKPFMITEFGANAVGGDKAAWIKEAFHSLRFYPFIRVAIWWDGIDWDGDQKARVYRLEDQDSLAAFGTGLQLYK